MYQAPSFTVWWIVNKGFDVVLTGVPQVYLLI